MLQYGNMYWWRFKGVGEWRFGFAGRAGDYSLVRMGRWNGDYDFGPIVSVSEIEWKRYSSY